MTIVPVEDRFDRRLALGATGSLATLNVAGVLEAADVHTAMRLTALAGDADERVALAVALTVRALRAGAVCVDLAAVADDVPPESCGGVAWPPAAEWVAALAASPLSGDPQTGEPPVLRVEGTLLYLDRYWREEEQVCADLRERDAVVPLDEAVLAAGLDRLLPVPHPTRDYAEQRAAAARAVAQATTVLTGGPGTGKTTTVAAVLALLQDQAATAGHTGLRIALAAPTGKAAARLQQAVAEEVASFSDPEDQRRLARLEAVTLHRLLGRRPDSSARFRHHRGNRLPHDVVVVDETSMVSLTMMARLLEAVRPEARLLLVGDPDQLSSVDAGVVLADLVAGLPDRVAALQTSHRFGSAIGQLAAAVRTGDADRALELLAAGDGPVTWVPDADPAPALQALVLPHALQLRECALAGDIPGALAALDQRRLLCAHRDGPAGVEHWNRKVEQWISEHTGEGIWSAWYPGRPFLVTANDYGVGLYNGDTGVALRDADGALRAVVPAGEETAVFAPSRLADVQTMHAMTIHKSQGSQADEVIVLLPPEESRLLTRELLYTAITRAKERVVLVGSEESLRAALATRAQRASGLQRRLAGSLDSPAENHRPEGRP